MGKIKTISAITSISNSLLTTLIQSYYDPRRIQPIRQQLRPLQRSELRTSKRMLAAHGTQDARKEHAGELCRGKSGRDNRRTALPVLRARPQGTLCVELSSIYDNVRAADLRRARHEVMAASALTFITRWSSCAAPSPKKSNETSASPLPKWATTALPLSSTAMKSSIPHWCGWQDTSRLRAPILDIRLTVP